MLLLPPNSTLTDTLFPYTTLSLSSLRQSQVEQLLDEPLEPNENRMIQTTSPSPLDTLLSTLRIEGDIAKAHIDEGWMQGRTAYGGISSAVALAGTMALHPTETPLRYAQISFVGPVGGDCTVETRVLRQSKSSLFVDAGVSSDQGFGTAAVFAFSGDRTSHVDHNRLAMPDAPDPDTLAPVPDHHARPSFTRHFDMRPTKIGRAHV